MDIPIHADVHCTDGTCGQTTAVVLDPRTMTVTHVVVKSRRFPYGLHLVPIEEVVESQAGELWLACSHDELEATRNFVDVEFLRPPDMPPTYSSAFAWPWVESEANLLTVEHEAVPPDELAVHRGDRVAASDGPLGRVEEFVIDSDSDRITHLVLRGGPLWGHRDIAIPVSAVDHIDEAEVVLGLSKAEVEALPSVPIHRSHSSHSLMGTFRL